MSKYINQDALCEFARHSTIGIDANDIMRFPSIEIIHCKDCKYFDADGVRGRQVDGQEVRMCKKFYNYPFLANEYCSRGERKKTK